MLKNLGTEKSSQKKQKQCKTTKMRVAICLKVGRIGTARQ